MTTKLARLGRLTPKQAWSIGRATAKICIWNGAVSAGKTITSLFKWMMLIPTAPQTGEIVMIGRTRDTVYRNLMTQLQNREIFGDLADHVHYNRGAPTATILGRTVHILGSSDVRAEATIRGMTISLAYLDEATLVTKEFFAMLVSRLRVKGFRCQLLCTTNPDAPKHWLKTDYMDRAHDPELSIVVFNFRLRDNARNLERPYIHGLEAQYTGLWKARFIDGEWTMADGVIYEMFDPAVHVVDQLPMMQQLLAIGIDDGVNHPAAGILLGLGADNRLYAMAEFAPPAGTPADRTRLLRRFENEHGTPDFHFVDPSAAALKLQMNREGFVNVANAANSHKLGIGVVASLLSTQQLMIHSSCTNLLNEIPGYVWDSKAVERGEDAPVKENDDFCDALRYAVATSQFQWRHAVPLPDDHRFDTEETAA
ncbi:phage terminase large subunit [Rhodococcus sp. HM1]|uniref:phage terminase large subunit n=1 Tax=Rhodococcus sp. HM1 TaxID=2937759 RepID=UPI00200AD760|nr:phage terminase large subunit [Rhodococcus sp. HM1]MCK8675120.1 phage terminase large subunit [Rhodococcus sp. HM1]